jgi:hypothetical protein
MRPDVTRQILCHLLINIGRKVANRVVGDVHFVVWLQNVNHLFRFT